MQTQAKWVVVVTTCLAAVVWAAGCGVRSSVDGVQVSTGTSTLTGSNEIRVTVPGRFKVVFCGGSKVEGSPEDTGVSGWYDLKHDPEERYNYASTWSGFFSDKIKVDPRRDGKHGSFMPGPGPVELLEANPVRAVVRYTWVGRDYGGIDNPASPDVQFEQTFVAYAPDKLYQTFAIVGIGEEVKTTHVELALHPSHAKFAGGESLKGGVYSIKAPWTFLPDNSQPPFGKTYLLHVAEPGVVEHGDGTRSLHKENFLLVLHKAAGPYCFRGSLWVGYRSSILFTGKENERVLSRGKRAEWHMVVHANHDMTDLEKAAPYVKEYREPGTPKCVKGKPIGDGFNEATGCYELTADKEGVDFELPVLCHWPAVEVSGWTGGAPRTIRIDGERARRGTDYLAGAESGRLLLQLRRDVNAGTRLTVAPDGSREDKGFFGDARPASQAKPKAESPFRLDAGPTGSKAEVKPPLVLGEGLKVIEVSEAGTLSQSDTKYVLSRDVSAPGTAFTFARGLKNVILDLGGHVVTYNTEKKERVAGRPYAECVYGIAAVGENIVIRNGTIVQGPGGNAASHAIKIEGGRAIEIANTMTRVHGLSTSNIGVTWTGPDGRIHDNYMENYSDGIAPGLHAPAGIGITHSGGNWEIYNNTVIGGHTGIGVAATTRKDRRSCYQIHHNFVSPRRVLGLKTPQGITCGSTAGDHVYENEISTDDARGLHTTAGQDYDMHHNFVACRYSREATKGNYPENRCYGYWERDCNGSRLHHNVFIVNNETMGDESSNSMGIQATTSNDQRRLRSGEFTDNRILCFHKDPKAAALGCAIKRSDKDVVVGGNEIVARTAAVTVFQLSDGVQVRGNVYLREKDAKGKMLDGDCIDKCTVEGNRELTLPTGGEAPRAPTGLEAIHRLEAIELRWTRNPEKDVIGYNVYADGNRINPFTLGGRFYVHLGVKPGEKHTYEISAVNLAGKESPKSAPLIVVQK